MKKPHVKIFAFVLVFIISLCTIGCSDGSGKATATPSASGVANPVKVKIDSAVSEEVKSQIDFDAYKNQQSYVLGEKNGDAEIKLLYPVNAYLTEKMDVKYHVELSKDEAGTNVLEIFGTDFSLPQGVKEVKVEWTKYSQSSEKMYRMERLCISLDGEVYFYEDEFYSPRIPGREIVVINK